MNASVQTFAAVILGAILATVGGFAATQLGIGIDRSRRARDAALLSGEILAAVGALLRLAESAAGQGTFLDSRAMRLLGAARREIEVYERNRELLFSLGDADLRARLHSFMVRLSIPLDRLADDHAMYRTLNARVDASGQAAEVRREMETAFGFLVESRKLIPDLLALLRPLARNSFESYSRINGDGILAGGSAVRSNRPKPPAPHGP